MRRTCDSKTCLRAGGRAGRRRGRAVVSGEGSHGVERGAAIGRVAGCASAAPSSAGRSSGAPLTLPLVLAAGRPPLGQGVVKIEAGDLECARGRPGARPKDAQDEMGVAHPRVGQSEADGLRRRIRLRRPRDLDGVPVACRDRHHVGRCFLWDGRRCRRLRVVADFVLVGRLAQVHDVCGGAAARRGARCLLRGVAALVLVGRLAQVYDVCACDATRRRALATRTLLRALATPTLLRAFATPTLLRAFATRTLLRGLFVDAPLPHGLACRCARGPKEGVLRGVVVLLPMRRVATVAAKPVGARGAARRPRKSGRHLAASSARARDSTWRKSLAEPFAFPFTLCILRAEFVLCRCLVQAW